MNAPLKLRPSLEWTKAFGLAPWNPTFTVLPEVPRHPVPSNYKFWTRTKVRKRFRELEPPFVPRSALRHAFFAGVTNAPKDTIQTFHPENFDTSKSTSTTTENAKVDEEDANFRFDQNQDDTSGESDTTTANPNENMIGINDGHDGMYL